MLDFNVITYYHILLFRDTQPIDHINEKKKRIYINDKGSDDFRARPTLLLFSCDANLLKRDTYPSAKVNKIIEIRALDALKHITTNCWK